MVYQAKNRSPKDANVIVRSSLSGNSDNVAPARILSLFSDRRTLENQVRLYVIVEKHVALSSTDRRHDPYLQFGFVAAGSIYHDRYHAPEVVDGDDLVTQFGRTLFFLDGIGADVVHVLPVFKVRPTLEKPYSLSLSI
jgi:hypothetical protein